jgi:UDP-N-acetyl-D-mannosaminuronic acid dehydrogenase
VEATTSARSLAFKLRKLLHAQGRRCCARDPYVATTGCAAGRRARQRADLLMIGAPHKPYRDLVTDQPIVDMWGIRREGVLV